MLESDMAEIGIKYLQHQKQFRLISHEVPFLSRCIDVVLLDNSEQLISIEFKVSKWRQAIEQANNHRLGADKAYICLPERKITEQLTQALSKKKVGLMFFNPEAKDIIYEVIPANYESKSIPVFRQMLLDNALRFNN